MKCQDVFPMEYGCTICQGEDDDHGVDYKDHKKDGNGDYEDVLGCSVKCQDVFPLGTPVAKAAPRSGLMADKVMHMMVMHMMVMHMMVLMIKIMRMRATIMRAMAMVMRCSVICQDVFPLNAPAANGCFLCMPRCVSYGWMHQLPRKEK